MHWNMSDIRFDGFSFSIYDCCLCASLYLFACIPKIARILFFLFHRMKTNSQNTTEVFVSVMSVKCDFSSSTSMTNTKTYNNSFRFHPFSMQHRIFTVYVYCVRVYVYIYYINCRCMSVLFCLPWLFWSAEDNVRATFCLIHTHTHTYTYKYIQVAHRKLFWTINKVNRRQKWVTCSSRHWMACANKAKGWFANANAVQCSKLLCVSFLVEVVDCAPKNESDTNMKWTVLGHIDRLTPVSTAFTSNWIVWLTTDTLSAAT